MAFIRQIEHEASDGDLRAFYDDVVSRAGSVPNVVKLSSLKPPAAIAAQDLYQSVLYHDSGLSMLEKEMVSTLVSSINGCAYCVAHHGAAVERLAGSANSAAWVTFAWRQADVDERTRAMLAFTEKLTANPDTLGETDVAALRAVGLSDEDVLDLVQLVAYFNYVNRLAMALGVDPEPET